MKDFKVRKSILTRKDCYSLEHGVNAVLKDRFETLNRRNVTAFCRKYGVSENVFFLTAYNLSIGIFSGEKDTVSSSIHSGRTDSRWNRLAGPLFLTYFFRCTETHGSDRAGASESEWKADHGHHALLHIQSSCR